MSYDAWIAQTEAGEIGSHSTHALVSDEAHRGTSQRRIDSIFKRFDGATIRTAFTATAHFDENKSVQHTHGREIFYKSLPDAVREGELVPYIQIRPFVISVRPKSEHDYTVPVNGDPSRRIDIRWAAWNKRVTSIFRTGIDNITGDPLSDNKTGFFTRNTLQGRCAGSRFKQRSCLKS